MDPTLLWCSCCFHPPWLHSTPLPLCPQCDCLACVLFQHPQQHSLRLQGLASWCKVNHTGERQDGERKRARETVCFLSPVRTRGRNITWLQKEEVCLQYHHQLMVMWHQHMPQRHKQFLTWKASLFVFYFLLVMSHKTNLFSTRRRGCRNPLFTFIGRANA